MAITFLILVITMATFIWGRFSLDVVALGSLLALYLADIIEIDEALSGFSNATVVLIATLFVVGEGLTRTGITAWFGDRLIDSSKGSATRLLAFTMGGAAVMSSVISNTATVAALMPAVVLAAWGVRSTPSRYLIPLAFAATGGGLLTLTGTAPNPVIANALDLAGERPFGFFEYAFIGAPLLIVMIVYMQALGGRLLPARSHSIPVNLDQEMTLLADAYSLEGDLYQLRVRVGSPLAGLTLRETDLGRRFGVAVLEIHAGRPDSLFEHLLPERIRERLERLRRDHPDISDPDQEIHHHDVLIVKGSKEAIRRLEAEMLLGVLPIADAGAELVDLLSQEIGIAEVLLTPRSSYVGSVIAEGGLGRGDLYVLGARRGERPLRLTEALQPGDSLLVRGKWQAIGSLADEFRDFVVVGRPDVLARQVTHLNRKSWTAVGSLAGMVILMVTGVVPVVIAALLAAGTMVVTGCLTTSQAYRSVSWSTILLIAGMIPMAAALQSTGGAQEVADLLIDTIGGAGSRTVLAGIMILALSLSQVIGNAATAVLLSPIVLSTAAGLGVDPHPLMMGLAVACSTAFIAPIANAPNLLVMGPGDYRFADYTKVGTPLSALFVIVGVILIPVIWSF